MTIKTMVSGMGALLVCLLLSGCGGADIVAEGPSARGTHTLCKFTANLKSDDYASARMSYPCDTASGPFPAVTLTGGYTNVKEQMYWLADHLTRHGFIVLTITPTNPLGLNPVWEAAHKAGFAQLLAQNVNGDSPVFNLIDTGNIGMVGYSYGGAGALLAANDLGDQVATVATMAPVFSQEVQISQVNSPYFILGGVEDTVLGPPAALQLIYNAMPYELPSALVELERVGHVDFVSTGGHHVIMKSYMVAWLTLMLKHSSQYMSYLNGDKHQSYISQGFVDSAEFDL